MGAQYSSGPLSHATTEFAAIMPTDRQAAPLDKAVLMPFTRDSWVCDFKSIDASSGIEGC